MPQKQRSNLVVSFTAIIFGLIVGAVIMLLSGYNPITGYITLFTSAFGSMQSIGDILRQMTPLLVIAAGFSVASTAGFFNIGLAGQALSGWVSSVWFALSFPNLPAYIMIPAAIIIGVLFGAILGGIPGYLRAKFGASEVINTIMLNYVVLLIANDSLREGMSRNILQTSDMTNPIGSNASLKMQWLTQLFGGSNVSAALFLALLALAGIWFVMTRTTLGFEIRSVGLNPDAARYAGVNDRRTAVFSMMISGGLAGLGGVFLGLGDYGNFFTQPNSLDVGNDGIAVALLGSGSFVAILGAALLFSVLKVGGLGMPTESGVPTELVEIIIATIIFFIGANYVIRLFLDKVDELDEKDKNKRAEKKAAKGKTS